MYAVVAHLKRLYEQLCTLVGFLVWGYISFTSGLSGIKKNAGKVNIDEKYIFPYVMVNENISCFRDILNFVTKEHFAL